MGTSGEVLQALARLEGMCRALCRTGKGGADEVAGLMLDEVWAIQDRLALQDRLEGRESGSKATGTDGLVYVAKMDAEAAEDGWKPVCASDWEALERGVGETVFTPEAVGEVIKSNWARVRGDSE